MLTLALENSPEGAMSDKYKKEIEEILKQAEEVMPKDRASPSVEQAGTSGGFFNQLGRRSRGRGLTFSPSRLMLTSFGLLLLALILGVIGGGSVVIFVVVAGLVLFVIAYALFFVSPGSPYEKRWRGRIIEDSPNLWDRFKRWLRG